jgi:hypothetical protein
MKKLLETDFFPQAPGADLAPPEAVPGLAAKGK